MGESNLLTGRLLWAKANTTQISLNVSLFSSSTPSVQVEGRLAAWLLCSQPENLRRCFQLLLCMCNTLTRPRQAGRTALPWESAGLPAPCPLHRGPFLSHCAGNLLWWIDKSQYLDRLKLCALYLRTYMAYMRGELFWFSLVLAKLYSSARFQLFSFRCHAIFFNFLILFLWDEILAPTKSNRTNLSGFHFLNSLSISKCPWGVCISLPWTYLHMFTCCQNRLLCYSQLPKYAVGTSDKMQ